MLARLLIKPFGNVWKIKDKCLSGSPFVSNAAKLLYGLYQYENNSSIAWNSKFKSEPFFPHGMKSIFVSGGASIGKNCIIYQQVTIGSIALIDAKKKGSPVIGDNVYIGSGAKIIGAVKVGDNVRIGANAVVYENIPDNCVMVAGGQQIIQKEPILDNRFYVFHKEWVYFRNGKLSPVTDKKIISKLIMSQK